MGMGACELKESLHSFGIGIVCTVVLMGIGAGMILITWSASGGILNSAPNRTDRLMMERSALLAAATVRTQVGPDKKIAE